MSKTTVHWLSVEDEFPDADMTVLVACLDEDTPVWIGITDGSAWFDAATGGEFVGRVTHWAEFPMSPNPDVGAPDDPVICAACNGSGQGQHDGTTCGYCRGKGIELADPEADPDAAERAWDAQQERLAERGFP